MMSCFSRLMSLFATRPTRAPQRTDWRGRPRSDGTAGASTPADGAEEDPYATICPRRYAATGGVQVSGQS
jgi:hypothetical protein